MYSIVIDCSVMLCNNINIAIDTIHVYIYCIYISY